MIVIKIDVKEVKKALKRLRHSAINLSPAMRDISARLESDTQEAFSNEGQQTLGGEKWQDLSAKYKKRRVTLGGGSYQILQKSGGDGGLLGSVHGFSDNNSAGVGAGSGKSAVYALIHQHGGMAGRNQRAKIPARPYLPITADDELLTKTKESILAIVRDHFSK